MKMARCHDFPVCLCVCVCRLDANHDLVTSYVEEEEKKMNLQDYAAASLSLRSKRIWPA